MKWIICDMDGTVIDSMKKLSLLGVHLMRIAGGVSETHARDIYTATVGQPFLQQIQSLVGPGDLADTYAEVYAEIHTMLAPYFSLTPFGVALANLSANECSLALVSSTSNRIIPLTSSLKLIPWRAIRGFDGTHEKMAQIDSIMSYYKVQTEDCIYVGDVASDKAIAKSLGIRFAWPEPEVINEFLCGTVHA